MGTLPDCPESLTPEASASGGVSPPVWPLADQTWSWGQLRYLRAIPLEVPLLPTVTASPLLFTGVPLGIFLRLFQSMSHSH